VSAPVSLVLLQVEVAEIRRKSKNGRSIGFHVAAPWTGPAELKAGDEELAVRYCPSPLSVRAELARGENAGKAVVLLTDRSESELGADVLARLAKQRLFRLDAWKALQERLGVERIDPRLARLLWLPDHLLALPEIPAEAGERAATQVLDADEVWQRLLKRLGFTSARPDLQDLLEWTTSGERLAAFLALSAEPREAYADRLAESGGAAGAAVLRLIASGRGSEAVSAGLVCDLLFGSDLSGDTEGAKAAGRFEARLLAGTNLEPVAGREWGAAATALIGTRISARGQAGVAQWLDQAERLLRELNMESLAGRSVWLASGFEERLADFATTLGGWLDHPDEARSQELAYAAQQVKNHGLRQARQGEVAAVEGLQRLSRYLQANKNGAPADSFGGATAAYARDGSFADLVRSSLTESRLPSALAAIRDRVLRAVAEQRETENRRFAELLAGWAESGSPTDTLVPIETVLDRVVAPLATARPVLLLVLDGLSLAVFHELAFDLVARGWEEVSLGGTRLHGIALLPTVTQVCRTSLLCGERCQGTASTEAQGFARHPGLREHGAAMRPPVLFHKGDLAAVGGAGLAETVRREVEGAERRVVAIVFNVVDDQLPKGRQLLPRWEISAVRYLDELLQAAAEAGRAVVLTADHGHVVERETELRRYEGGGARFRPTGVPPGDGEVAVRGPRVLLGDGTGLVLAWSERLRYSALQSGYHGGASPQEVVVPLSVWAPFDAEIAGWEPTAADWPDWWEVDAGPSASAPPAGPAAISVKPGAKTRSAERKAQGVLFGTTPAGERWLTDLFNSPVYAEQRNLAGRQGLTEEIVASVLRTLAQRGGRMTLNALAHQLAVIAPRARGLVATLQRVLNVEGFPVLSLDPESDTLSLDRDLLAKQFPPDRGGS